MRAIRVAYADPPYEGQARKHYGKNGDPFAGTVGEVEPLSRHRSSRGRMGPLLQSDEARGMTDGGLRTELRCPL